jgi:hypothetical protein
VERDGEDVNADGSAFEALAAATGNDLSPSVLRRVAGTTSSAVDAERSR